MLLDVNPVQNVCRGVIDGPWKRGIRVAMSTSPGSPDRFWSHRRSIPQANSVATVLQTVTRLAAGLLTVAGATASWAGTTAEWKGGGGAWENAAMWGGTLPSRTAEARINGTQDKPSQVILAHTNVLVTRLAVGDGGNSLASLILDGPSLTASGGMDVGKHTGSDGRLVVKSGHLFAGIIFVSGGGGPGQRGRGAIEIEGGSVVTKNIALGNSSGSRGTLHIVGSKASAIAVDDYLCIGVYNYLEVEKEPPPSAT